MTFATKRFWLDALERAIKTAAQAILALVTVNVTGITDLDLTQTLSVAGLAVLVSVLTSLVSAGPAGSNASAVLKDEDVVIVDAAGADDEQYRLLRNTGNGTTVENEDDILADDPDLAYDETTGVYDSRSTDEYIGEHRAESFDEDDLLDENGELR